MNVFCFDFDGVICDSAPETALTAWKCCKELWPGRTADWSESLQQRFCRLRPVIHTGFEAIPLMRLILDGDASDETILARFPARRDEIMGREGLSGEQLQRVFGGVRDALIAEDEMQWLRWNRFYPGLREMLAEALERHPLNIITTKQERFAALLLRHHGLTLPADRIFGLERHRSKPEILGELVRRSEWAGAAFHFIEDRLDTLEQVIAAPALSALRLYLADWGYNTPAQREAVGRMPRIEVISPRALRQVLAE